MINDVGLDPFPCSMVKELHELSGGQAFFS
jgi:hypothetical protein